MQITLTKIGGLFSSNTKLSIDTKDIKRMEETDGETILSTNDGKDYTVKESIDEIAKLANKTPEAKA